MPQGSSSLGFAYMDEGDVFGWVYIAPDVTPGTGNYSSTSDDLADNADSRDA